MDTLEKPIITVIGTCRVHDTLRQIEKTGLIQLNNGGVSTYVHSLPEIFLRLKVYNREEKYSTEIMDLQVDTRSGTEIEPNDDFDLNYSDIVVIEVSSLKSIFYKKQPLQYNEINRQLCTPHGDFGKELIANINYAFNNDKDKIKFPETPLPKTMSDKHALIVKKIKPKLMNEKNIRQHLELISEYIKKPILYVNHINIEATNGKKITSRNRLCKIIKKYCVEKNFALFEPSALFSEYDRVTLLAKNGTDLAHYAKHALEIVGMEQYKKILESLSAPI